MRNAGIDGAVYKWIEHTSEVELEIRAESEAGVFADALSALAELLGFAGQRPAGLGERRAVAVTPDGRADRAALLVGWLEELNFLAESEGFVALRLSDLELRASELVAGVDGVVAEPPPLVKAVTLHRLRFERRDAGYIARVVLDV